MSDTQELIHALLHLVHEMREDREQRKHENVILRRLAEMENNLMIKVSEVKAAVAQFKTQNREALAEIGTKIADLNKQIADLIAGVGDPEVTDEVFEQDLRDLAADAKALADIVPGTPTPEPPSA